jgi:hypothetical protein
MNINDIKVKEIFYLVNKISNVYYMCEMHDEKLIHVLRKYDFNFNRLEDMPYYTYGIWNCDVVLKTENECKDYILLNKL